MTLDRPKVLNWWTCRMSDAELAEIAGSMTRRSVGLVLEQPALRKQVSGGGRGSKNSRRLSPFARNAIGVVNRLNVACGLSIETAAAVVGECRAVLQSAQEVLDFSHWGEPVVSLMAVDPQGGWLPTDIVPQQLWTRRVMKCRAANDPNPSPGNIFRLTEAMWQPDSTGAMKHPTKGIDLVPITGQWEYDGELDPIGLYAADFAGRALDQFDDHLIIVNGEWVFSRSPDPSPIEAMTMMMEGVFLKDRGRPEFHTIAEARINRRAGTVTRIDDDDPAAAAAIQNAETLFDLNVALVLRTMKRRAYGLPVAEGAWDV